MGTTPVTAPAGTGNEQQLHQSFTFRSAFALAFVFLVHQLRIPSANRDPHDFETLALKCQDLASNERVTDFGILVDQIGYSHALLILDNAGPTI